MRISFKNVLVVVKQTPYEQYMQLKNQGKAPVALRWQRLKNRYENHRKCVDNVVDIIKKLGADAITVIGREELYRGSLVDKDIVVAVGGDGTVLNSASFLDQNIPLLGVNSDPSRPDELGLLKVRDERRSYGALCAATSQDLDLTLPRIFLGDVTPGIRSRMRCVVRSTYTETKLPPALNDILLAHPIPAAVSRFRLTMKTAADSYSVNEEEVFSYNSWSSGMWLCTATGSTAAMKASGGEVMDLRSKSLQYRVRAQIEEIGNEELSHLGYGFIHDNQHLDVRWNSQYGALYVDGAHMKHDLELGDEIRFDVQSPVLHLFDKVIAP